VPANIRTRVQFLGHASDPADVAAVCRACDVLVLPSEQDRWALVVNEAAAAGMAIVSSDVPGAVADLVRDGVNGRVFPVNNLPALRECLLDVTDGAKTDAMGAASLAVLAEWRQRGDPIQGLRDALQFAGVLKPAESGQPLGTGPAAQ
jgi:glycosyltransferase involved in cell wall biosynthesis